MIRRTGGRRLSMSKPAEPTPVTTRAERTEEMLFKAIGNYYPNLEWDDKQHIAEEMLLMLAAYKPQLRFKKVR